MSDFDTLLDEYLGDQDDISDIRLIVRRAYFYDFLNEPIRIWQGKGRLFTSDGNEWLGSIDGGDTDHHSVPSIQDGRDGSSANYNFSLTIPDVPGDSPLELYNGLKADQFRVNGRYLTIYMVLFQLDEGLRPTTPIRYFKQLTMQSPKFSEKVTQDASGTLVKSYAVSVTARDANYGRSRIPNRTLQDSIQKEYARQLGQSVDRGCEFLAALANKTFIVP